MSVRSDAERITDRRY